MNRLSIALLSMWTLLLSCERVIEVPLPANTEKLVVEGRIEEGLPPFVFLSKSVGYFEPTSIARIQELQVLNADVQVIANGISYPLEVICSDQLTTSQQALASELLGVSITDSSAFSICFYTLPLSDLIGGGSLVGEALNTYDLVINWQGDSYTASTTIPQAVPFDSLWFTLEQDSFGLIRGKLTDPDTAGNYYRFFAQRINLDSNGNRFDNFFVADRGSVFDDQYFNGQPFNFVFERGRIPGVEEEYTKESRPDFWKYGDTVITKFCAIDKPHFDFLRTFEVQQFSGGNPFSAPANVPTNLSNGALGVWGGYGITYDTLICLPN